MSAENPTAANGKRLIRLADLFAKLGVSKPTGVQLIAAGKIGPQAIRLLFAERSASGGE